MTNRMGMYVYYQGKKVLEKLQSLDVSVTYSSKKQHYSIFYCDAEKEKEIRRFLQYTKGFKYIGVSLMLGTEYNF